jgi:hypothetical protein
MITRSMSVLVHGEAKSGKSTLAVTAPAPRLLFDVESASRFLTARGLIVPTKWDPQTEAPPILDGTWDTAVVNTKTWNDVAQGYKWLESGQHPWSSVIIDSVTELQVRFMENLVGRAQLTQQQWGDAFRVVSGLVRDLRDLTEHEVKPIEAMVFTAMTREYNGTYKAYVAGQLVTVLPYLVDLVGYLWSETIVNDLTGEPYEVHRLLTKRTAQFEAGERLGGALPDVVDYPNIVTMLDTVFGAKQVEG